MTAKTSYPDVATAHNRDLSLQKYMLLYSQHQALRENLARLRPLVTMTSYNSPIASPTHSPDRSPFSSEKPATTPVYPNSRTHGRRASLPVHDDTADRYRSRRGGRLEAIADQRTICEMAAEERKLFEVNECMKRMLTELLNCEDARRDPSFRMWVQCRLMETERELRVERRRKSSIGTDNGC